MIKFADILPSFAALGWKKRRLNKGIFFPSTGCFIFSRLDSLELGSNDSKTIHRIVCTFKGSLNLTFISLD